MAAAEAAGLPADILQAIRSHLPIVDYLRFPAVCTAWRSASRDQASLPHLPRGPPWLLARSPDSNTIYGIDCFVNIDAPKVYRFPLPEYLRGYRLFSSVGHCLLLEKEGTLSGIRLFNPFASSSSTHAACLPPSATLTEPTFRYPGYKDLHQIHTIVTDTTIGIAFALGQFCPPSYIILDCNGPAFDSGNPAGRWINLSHLLPDPSTSFGTAAPYKDGLICAADVDGDTVVAFDFSRAPAVKLVDITFNLPPTPHRSTFEPVDWTCYHTFSLVNSGSSLFLVRWRKIFKTDGANVREMDVHRLDDAGISKHWVPVKSLGDRSFFIGHRQSASISTVDFPGLESNRVYLHRDTGIHITGNRRACPSDDDDDLGCYHVYNLEDESWGVFYFHDFKARHAYFPPFVFMIPRSL